MKVFTIHYFYIFHAIFSYNLIIMSRKTILILSAIFMIAVPVNASEWEKIKEEEGITIFTRQVDDSDLKEVKATMTLKTSLSSMVALITKADLYHVWSYNVESAKALKTTNDTMIYGYTLMDVPWPASNRDMVWLLRVRQDPETKVVSTYSTMIPDYIPENPGIVRLREATASWVLTPKPDGTVEMEYTAGFDPGGNVPSWIINFGITSGPMHNFKKIKEVVYRSEYQEAILPFIKEL